MNNYTIEEHRHRFAAWAAGTASTVKACRFSVKQAREIIETIGLLQFSKSITDTRYHEDFDQDHRKLRLSAIAAARAIGLTFTHGVSAKLINVYLKSMLTCSGIHEGALACSLHPPIDSLLLDSLVQNNVGGLLPEWRKAKRIRWSKLNSDEYEGLMRNIRLALGPGVPLWKIEAYWRGFQ